MTNFMSNMTAGMTISYPIQHSALNNGYIREIGKDFPFKKINIKKEELVENTTKAFQKYNINIHIKVLLNDTTATLASAVRSDDVFYIGIVLGTGTNIAFNDKILYENQIINTEIASFDSEHLRKNIYDMKIKEDILSSNKIYKPLDCMLGGYQLVKLFNLAIKDQFDRENYTLDDIVHLLDLPPGNSNYTEEFYVILSIKKRTMRILASMVFGILEAQEVDSKIKIVLNGTVFEQDYDRRIFIDEIRRLCADSTAYKYKHFTFESICDATLRGIARILLQVD
ncbi:Hexokinase [Trachipleistophora hominis]|uniref:Phosphotransferase n=1 Tax=Trachipleistophora hominis TaxID=72359 RepID=L7JUZ4_TRAHO|nr:Hexokinase [Trachipleistophora hominis]